MILSPCPGGHVHGRPGNFRATLFAYFPSKESLVLQGVGEDDLAQQRQALARVLAEDHGQPAATLMAAQIAATVLTLQESVFHLLAGDASPGQVTRSLAEDTELAFDLLAHGHAKGR